jgi:hypothetical protein
LIIRPQAKTKAKFAACCDLLSEMNLSNAGQPIFTRIGTTEPPIPACSRLIRSADWAKKTENTIDSGSVPYPGLPPCPGLAVLRSRLRQVS